MNNAVLLILMWNLGSILGGVRRPILNAKDCEKINVITKIKTNLFVKTT